MKAIPLWSLTWFLLGMSLTSHEPVLFIAASLACLIWAIHQWEKE